MAAQRRRRSPYVACGLCGSEAVHPRYLVSGFIPFVNDHGEVYHCDACDRDVPHLRFEAEENLRAFQASLREPQRPSPPDGLEFLPILPLHTGGLGDPEIFDGGPMAGGFARVSGVAWNGYGLVRSAYDLPFGTYWDLARGVLPGDRILLVDLDGIAEGRPHFGVLKELLRGRYNVWLEMGVRDEEDIMDALVLDAERVLVGTMTLPSLEVLQRGYDLAEATTPCIYLSGEPLWRGPGRPALAELLRSVAAIGYSTVAVVDLPRLGTGEGPREELLKDLSHFDLDIYVGGGVRRKDEDLLRANAIRGGLLDPFLPDIPSKVPRPQAEPSPTAVPASWVSPRRRASPS